MKKTFALFLTLIFLCAPAFAQQGYSYNSGIPTTNVAPQQPTPPPLPAQPQQGYGQALQQVGQAPAIQQPACSPCPQLQMQQQQNQDAAQIQMQSAAATVSTDPCAAYQTQDGYALCQDRVTKLQRIQGYRDNQVKVREDKAQARLDAIAAAAKKKEAPVPIEKAIGVPDNFNSHIIPATTPPPAK